MTVANVLLADDSHLTIVPTFPDNVNAVEFVPEQTVALPAIVPPAETGSTVTVAVAELVSAQVPLFTTAL